MLKLNVQVPEARDRAAMATLRDGLKTIEVDHAAASATPPIAAQRGNPNCDPLRLWGHPPLGKYRLLAHRPTSPEQAREYGGHLLVFEPQSGAALDAESFGRIGLLVYAGATDRERRLRRTQGGVRLTNEMLAAIVQRLGAGVEMELELEPYRTPAWWQFWKPRVALQPLSVSTLAPLAPPADEVSILVDLMRSVVKRAPRDLRDDRDGARDTDRSDYRSSSSRTEAEPFRGKGGESGGAGASMGWDTGPGAGRGVDASGRIIAGAAAGAALAAMAHAATKSETRESTDSAESISTGSESAFSGSAESGTRSETSTSTSY